MAGGKRKHTDDEPEWVKRGKHDGSFSEPVEMEIDDDGTIINRGRQSLPNLPKRTQVQSAMTNGSGSGDGDGSGNAIGLKETPVDNPHNVFRGPPDYTFVSLPYAYDLLQNQGNAFANDYIFRMTSPSVNVSSASTRNLSRQFKFMNEKDVTPPPMSVKMLSVLGKLPLGA